jgi:Beta-propeller repeat/Protein of unknown function (DUF1573)
MLNRWQSLLFPALVVFSSCYGHAGADPTTLGSESIPIVFEQNLGQSEACYRYVSRHSPADLLFSDTHVDMIVPGSDHDTSRILLQFVGSRKGVIPEGRGPLQSVSNYLIGNDPSRWIRSVPNFTQIVYSGIYPGVDLVFHGNNHHMEYDFRVAAGADPSGVRFKIGGEHGFLLTSSGDLSISFPDGKLLLRKPVAYQMSRGIRHIIPADFALTRDHSVEFRLGAYDKGSELVIDPVFSFSTYLAGNSYDQAFGLTTDSSGNIYVTGTTSSLDFPIKNGIQTTNGGSDGFVSKLDPTGHTLLYSTYLGGSGSYGMTTGGLIALDSNGNIVVAGISSSVDFPHVGSVPVTTCTDGNSCYFLVSLNPDGSAFNYAGLIGGAQASIQLYDGQSVIASFFVDKSANVYLAGITDSSAFEITPGTLATSVPNYPYDSTFVLKANSSGALVYSTIIPGTSQDTGVYNNVFFPVGVFVDAEGQATIAGTAGPGLPTTSGVVQATFPNSLDVGIPSAGFVLQLNAEASAINYATYVPGTDTIGGFAVDSSGNSYLTGGTSETNLPVSGNAYQKTLKTGNGCTCDGGFLLKLDGAGKNVLAATYLGGTPAPGGSGTGFYGLALDSHSNVFVGGMTVSADFPLVNPFVSIVESGDFDGDLVLAEMSPDLSSLLFGSFLSSTDQSLAASAFSAIAVDFQNNLVVAGRTSTTDFPTTAGSFQPTPPAQGFHPFIAKLDMTTAAPSVCSDSWSVNFGNVLAKTSSTAVVDLTNCGNATLSIESASSSAATVVVKDSCSTVQPGSVCPISLVFTPSDTSTTSGTLTVKDNTVITPQVISFSGQGVAPQISPSSGSIDFGHLFVNTKGAGDTMMFFNKGTAPLSITAASVDGDFAATNDLCITTLQPGDSCFITVTFSPTTAGIRTGTLAITSNDPANPQVGLSLVGTGDSVYAVPVIAALNSPTAQINNGPVTVQVLGANFYPASVIQVNGVSQPTTYSSEGEVQATLSSSVVGSIGEVSVTVMNPSPGGGTSVAIPLTLYQGLSIGAAFLASVPGSQMIYASIPSSAATNPNTVIPINPATGALGKPIPVGNNPDLLAASSDGSYLFVVAEQDQTVQRINLSTQAVDQTFPFPTSNTTCCGTVSGNDLQGVPGSPQEVVLALTDYSVDEMALYNNTGLVNYVPNPTPSPDNVNFSSLAFAGNPLTIYTLPFTNAQTPFFNVIAITSVGLQFTPYIGANFGGNTTTGAQVVSDGTLLYTVSGQIWNPATQTEVGTFPVTLDNATSYPNLQDLLMDLTSGQLFTIGDQPYEIDSDALTLSAYGQVSHKLNGALAFPSVSAVLPQSLVRWGTNGFAFTAGGIVYLLNSSLATAVSSNPIPNLVSVTPSSLAKGTLDSEITLNGSGLTAGSVVMWNKGALQTTYVAGTVLTAMVPASDFANSGTASVTVSNPSPGGGNSNAMSFTITSLTPLISFSSSAAVFSGENIDASSAAQIIAVQNPGTATLNISSIAITGSGAQSFQQTNTCGSSLAVSANCAISVTFKPTAGGLQSASVTVTDNASGSPHAIAISGTGLGLGLAVASGKSGSATVTAGTTATYSLTIGGQGVAGSVTITCSGAPKGANCSVPGTVNLSAASTSPLTVTVTTTSTTASRFPNRSDWAWAMFMLVGVSLMQTSRSRAKSAFKILPLLLMMLICSCGGGGRSSSGNPNGTPAGQYTITVTATGESYTQSLPLTLIVQ